MSNVFIIGDRLKNEWVKVLDTETKQLQFSSQLSEAQSYVEEVVARQQLLKLRETGYFNDLQVYVKENDKAIKLEERDFYQP
jgi:hypothetical protein